jgi:hypothetical protein
MILEGGFATGVLEDGTETSGLLQIGDLDSYCAIFSPGTIDAGATATNFFAVQRANAARDSVKLAVVNGDARLIYSAIVSSSNNVQVRAFNPTGSSIVAAPCEVRFEVER